MSRRILKEKPETLKMQLRRKVRQQLFLRLQETTYQMKIQLKKHNKSWGSSFKKTNDIATSSEQKIMLALANLTAKFSERKSGDFVLTSSWNQIHRSEPANQELIVPSTLDTDLHEIEIMRASSVVTNPV